MARGTATRPLLPHRWRCTLLLTRACLPRCPDFAIANNVGAVAAKEEVWEVSGGWLRNRTPQSTGGAASLTDPALQPLGTAGTCCWWGRSQHLRAPHAPALGARAQPTVRTPTRAARPRACLDVGISAQSVTNLSLQ